MIANGGFESGRTIWSESSSGGYWLITRDELPHWGSWSAWLGGYEYADDRVYQIIEVPAWARSARLQFYLYVRSDDVDWPYDFFHAELQSSSGASLQQFASADNTWKAANWYRITQNWSDFGTHAGTQRRLLFKGTNDYSLSTDFFVDDVSFVAYQGTLAQGSETGDEFQVELVAGDEVNPLQRSGR